MKDAVLGAIFDWDGVVFGSEPSCLEATNAILRDHGAPLVTANEFRNRSGNGFEWFRERGVSLSAEEIRALFYQYFDTSRCSLVSGIEYVLGQLSKKGIPCGIVSAHHEAEIKQRVKIFGIEQYFSIIIGDARHGKQDALVRACRTFGVVRGRALFVEDMPAGVIDGKNVGLQTALYAPRNSPHAMHADYHILHPLDLLDIV